MQPRGGPSPDTERTDRQTDRRASTYDHLSAAMGAGGGEGGISHHESPRKAREGAETAPKGGPHAPAQPRGDRQVREVQSLPHHDCLLAPCPSSPSVSHPIPRNVFSLCCAISLCAIAVLRPPHLPGGTQVQPHPSTDVHPIPPGRLIPGEQDL